MKSGGGVGTAAAYPSLPAKKRWRGLVIGVLALVVLSLLVPLVFVLGLQSGLYSSSGYGAELRKSASSRLKTYDRRDNDGTRDQTKENKSTHIDEIIKKLAPTTPKDIARKSSEKAANIKTSGEDLERNSIEKAANSKISGHPMLVDVPNQRLKANNTRLKDSGDTTDSMQGIEESVRLCEFRFGTYCLWRQGHKEEMNDSLVKKMKDLLFVARSYYPSIAKLPKLDKLTNEMKQNIQEFERVFSESTTDNDLPPQIEKKVVKMEAVIKKAKLQPVDCNNVDKKFRQLVDLTEDETNFHMKQSAFLYQLVVQTMPKSHHCLSMRLTVEYFKSSLPDSAESLSNQHVNPKMQHYVILSNNVLASSVVINSTVVHSKESKNQVFHVLTDKENFFAMKMWFFQNKYKEAVIQVLNVEELVLNGHDAALHLSLPEEFRVSFQKMNKLSAGIRTDYISVFSHLHYLLPIIFPTLEKIVVLDDDVVVQRDLSSLWSLNMDGKVNGAVQVCSMKFGQLEKNAGEENFNEDYCAWMSGLNIIDLVSWRQQDLTKVYQRLMQQPTKNKEGLSDASTLLASLLTFQGNIYALDDEWMVSGLGHNYGVDIEAIEKAAVLHFNGKMKPWLDVGISNYTKLWAKYVNQNNQFLGDCNVNTKS